MSKPNVLALLCAVMAVEAIEMTDDGVFLNKEQLDKIEAELKKLQGEKTTAVNDLTAAKAEGGNAASTLAGVIATMNDLDTTVKSAATPAAKVEAIRKKLAEKPGVGATGAQTVADQHKRVYKGTDEVNDYVKGLI